MRAKLAEWFDAPVGYLASFRAYCDRTGTDFDAYLKPDSQNELYTLRLFDAGDDPELPAAADRIEGRIGRFARLAL